MLEELSDGITRFVKGGLVDIESDFRTIKIENPGLSFPECVARYEAEHGAKLNSVHLNHGMRGFESAVKELGQG